MKAIYNGLQEDLGTNYYLLNKVLADRGITREQFDRDLEEDDELKILIDKAKGDIQFAIVSQVFIGNPLRIPQQVLVRLLDTDLFKDTVYKKYEKDNNKITSSNKDITID